LAAPVAPQQQRAQAEADQQRRAVHVAARGEHRQDGVTARTDAVAIGHRRGGRSGASVGMPAASFPAGRVSSPPAAIFGFQLAGSARRTLKPP
jgi:hypothetical protein